MASYYPTTRDSRQHTPRCDTDSSGLCTSHLLPLDVAEESIYIFPAPSSLPASPGASSIYSAPSDFTDFSDATRSLSVSLNSSAHRSSVQGQLSSESTSGVVPEPRTGFWEWLKPRGTLDEEGYREVDEQHEAKSNGNAVPHQPIENPFFPRQSAPPPALNNPLARYYYTSSRQRTQSHASSANSAQSRNQPAFPPCPRMRIPLLSFFAWLLSIHPDDPVLRLLNQSSPDTVLFPGQSSLLGLGDNELMTMPFEQPTWSTASEGIASDGSKHHGLLRLRGGGVLQMVAN